MWRIDAAGSGRGEDRVYAMWNGVSRVARWQHVLLHLHLQLQSARLQLLLYPPPSRGLSALTRFPVPVGPRRERHRVRNHLRRDWRRSCYGTGILRRCRSEYVIPARLARFLLFGRAGVLIRTLCTSLARARAPAGYRQKGGSQESREQTMLNGTLALRLASPASTLR